MDTCPVCNSQVKDKKYSGILDGVAYYFCCGECEKNFEFEPRKYMNCCMKKEKSKEK